jgi:hypothetical protein
MKTGSREPVLELLLAEDESVSPTSAHGGVAIGTITGFDAAGRPLVTLSEAPPDEAKPARTTIPLGGSRLGAEVVLAFEGGNTDRPIIMGLLVEPGQGQRKLEAEVDGEALVLSAKREIVLRCGKASITLTRAGKVLLRGAYLLSRSSGVNRVKGASVQIN